MGDGAFILIVSPNEQRGLELRDALRQRRGHSCSLVTDMEGALDSIRRRMPDVVVADGSVNGPATLSELAAVLDRKSHDAALLSIGNGQIDARSAHITVASLSPEASVQELVDSIDQAARKAVARREDRILKETLAGAEIPEFEGIVGSSPQMRRIVERIRKAASNKLTVLILGETGTGKDLIAHAIHRCSDRCNKPFKALNCAGLNENLLESELFGHVKGAFTSAFADRKGYFEAAHGGTLFLDEIGDMPVTMQARLLRALDSREITPVGSTDVRRVDVRVVAATHRNLHHLVEEGKFREDLYYRLHQLVIEVPPLRDRRQDIPLLTHHFIQRANKSHGASVPGISNEAMGYLTRYYWPGNVRELANLVETLVVEAADRQIEGDDLPERIRGSRAIVPASFGSIAGLTMSEIEKLVIQHTLNNTGGNREQAARMLGIGTRTLYRKIKEYGLT